MPACPRRSYTAVVFECCEFARPGVRAGLGIPSATRGILPGDLWSGCRCCMILRDTSGYDDRRRRGGSPGHMLS